MDEQQTTPPIYATRVAILNRLRGVRRVLDDLYADLDQHAETNAPGSWATKMAVSDAIDAIDRALLFAPSGESHG